MKRYLFSLGLSLLCIAASASPSAAAEAPPGDRQPDGTLITADAGDRSVYYIDNGEARRIDSADTFAVHGFNWDAIVVVPFADLNLYPAGETLTARSKIVLPGEAEVLPDLQPFGAGNMRLSSVGGRTVLRFSTSFRNAGKGPFELITRPDAGKPADGTYHTAFQHIVRKDGSARDKIVGSFLFHQTHDHYHHADFADYKLLMVRPAAGSPMTANAITQKTTFCMRDDTRTNPENPASPRYAVYVGCGRLKQGVSAGWTDVYSYTLPDQYFDVHDLPAGIYKLSIEIDPRSYFVEGRIDNNLSVSLVELDVKNGVLKVVADTAPFENRWNFYKEGMVVRAAETGETYVIHDNRKRRLRTDEIFASYGYSQADVYEFPKSIIDAIPRTRVIRPTGSPDIYLVNDTGYRRKILNPEVFGSYGFTWAEVAEVNATEFAGFQTNDLIMRAGDNRVFSIRDRRVIGSFASLPSLGHELASVHLVNETDFSAYTVSVFARGLNVPWDIVFLPDGDMLVTERPGTVKRIGRHQATITVPSVLHIGEGGLMGVALHPNFATNNYVYLYFTASDNGRENRIERFRLEGDALVPDKVILDSIPAALYHDGGQIVFGPDGMLYVTIGDAEKPATAQDLGSVSGKTLRLTPEGGVPADNPFGTVVWSYGHRNAQGLAWDDQGRMWQTEHGRSGALSGMDELNLVEKGKNYGWPTIQGDATSAGMVNPVRHSGPDVTWAPSGLAHVKGSLFFAGLRGQSLYRATIGANGTITDLKAYLAGQYGRLRAVVLGPDGMLYVTTSNRDGRGTPRTGDDKILRIAPDLF